MYYDGTSVCLSVRPVPLLPLVVCQVVIAVRQYLQHMYMQQGPASESIQSQFQFKLVDPRATIESFGNSRPPKISVNVVLFCVLYLAHYRRIRVFEFQIGIGNHLVRVV